VVSGNLSQMALSSESINHVPTILWVPPYFLAWQDDPEPSCSFLLRVSCFSKEWKFLTRVSGTYRPRSRSIRKKVSDRDLVIALGEATAVGRTLETCCTVALERLRTNL
jgi:hypothetical protein